MQIYKSFPQQNSFCEEQNHDSNLGSFLEYQDQKSFDIHKMKTSDLRSSRAPSVQALAQKTS